jgi:hypothetical protein
VSKLVDCGVLMGVSLLTEHDVPIEFVLGGIADITRLP